MRGRTLKLNSIENMNTPELTFKRESCPATDRNQAADLDSLAQRIAYLNNALSGAVGKSEQAKCCRENDRAYLARLAAGFCLSSHTGGHHVAIITNDKSPNNRLAIITGNFGDWL